MCEFPSWIKTDEGKCFWLTDKDIIRFHENGTDKITWYDFIGHHAIEKVYGERGEHMEGFGCIPDGFKADIKSGKCREMMGAYGIKAITFRGTCVAIEYANGTKMWYKNGKHDRANGLPAIEYADGTKYWYKDGKRGRANGLPANECANGTKAWYKNGELDRVNGLPAVEYADGTKEWYKNGELDRANGLPAIEYADGTKEWYKDGYCIRTESGK